MCGGNSSDLNGAGLCHPGIRSDNALASWPLDWPPSGCGLSRLTPNSRTRFAAAAGLLTCGTESRTMGRPAVTTGLGWCTSLDRKGEPDADVDAAAEAAAEGETDVGEDDEAVAAAAAVMKGISRGEASASSSSSSCSCSISCSPSSSSSSSSSLENLLLVVANSIYR
uniref:Uncharacterized protein n=1 Tax=Oryza punctata TaxID=4537 RepID=A0A0E0KUC0_ORYPU